MHVVVPKPLRTLRRHAIGPFYCICAVVAARLVSETMAGRVVDQMFGGLTLANGVSFLMKFERPRDTDCHQQVIIFVIFASVLNKSRELACLIA